MGLGWQTPVAAGVGTVSNVPAFGTAKMGAAPASTAGALVGGDEIVPQLSTPAAQVLPVAAPAPELAPPAPAVPELETPPPVVPVPVCAKAH